MERRFQRVIPWRQRGKLGGAPACPAPIPALSRSCDGSSVSLSQNARRLLLTHLRRGPGFTMNHAFSARSLALFAGASSLALLLDQPAQAHGMAQGGVTTGFLHPITGADHLLLLIAVGAAAACLTSRLLLWGLAGAIAGGVFGVMGGSLPAQELLAALAITAVAVLVLCSVGSNPAPGFGFGAALVAAAVGIHAMIHGLEAPVDGSAAQWWLGAGAGSILVTGSSFLLLRRLPLAWIGGVALLLAVSGCVVALG